MNLRRFTSRRWTALWMVLTLLAIFSAWKLVKVLSPAPPQHISMSTGVVDGAYHAHGLKYQAFLKANGIELELKPSSGSVENLKRLNEGEVSVSFVQGGLGVLAQNQTTDGRDSSLRSLATIGLEPVWIFSHALDLTQGLAPLIGKRVAVGVAGSGNHQVALELLAAYGVTDARGTPTGATQLITEGGMAAAEKLQAQALDAMIVIAAPQAAAVSRLLSDSTMQLASLAQAEGLARRYPYFQTVSLKQGSVDPARNQPSQDIRLLATTANLVIREDLHPALAYLLLEAANQIHRPAGLLNRPGEFLEVPGAGHCHTHAQRRGARCIAPAARWH